MPSQSAEPPPHVATASLRSPYPLQVQPVRTAFEPTPLPPPGTASSAYPYPYPYRPPFPGAVPPLYPSSAFGILPPISYQSFPPGIQQAFPPAKACPSGVNWRLPTYTLASAIQLALPPHAPINEPPFVSPSLRNLRNQILHLSLSNPNRQVQCQIRLLLYHSKCAIDLTLESAGYPDVNTFTYAHIALALTHVWFALYTVPKIIMRNYLSTPIIVPNLAAELASHRII